VKELPSDARRELFDRLKEVLETSMRRGRIPDEPGWLEHVRGEPEGRCPRCDGKLEHERVAGRTAVFCPRCQKDGR
jgi:formamidopyrimidine-DNA glycosylase